MATPWELLSGRLIARWQQDELVAFVGEPDALAERLADWLAGQAEGRVTADRLVEWLLEQDEVDDIFADDEAMSRSLKREARAVADPLPDPAEIERSVEQAERAAQEAERLRIYTAVVPLMASFGRRAYLPEVTAEDGPPNASKYHGTPYLRPDESWPCCENCELPMALFVQLDLATLPVAAHPHRNGLIQLFYCTNSEPLCEVDCEAWDVGAASTLVRWLLANEPAREPSAAERPAPERSASPSHIIGWTLTDPELPAYGDEDDLIQELEEQAIEWSVLAERKLTARVGDKLVGWPAWVQDPNYPRCPDCRAAMEYLLQLESNGLCHHQFGDLGAGHLFQCARHPDYVAFNWSGH